MGSAKPLQARERVFRITLAYDDWCAKICRRGNLDAEKMADRFGVVVFP